MKPLVIAALGLLTLLAAQARTYPSRPVTLVVPFPPGGGTDTGARLIAQKLSAKWGQPVVVDNKGGAAGQIGADLVAKAKPDGYSILMGNIGTQAINPPLYPKLPYDPDKAFAPISLVAELPLAMMVNLNVAAKTAQEFVLLARSKPGQLSYSSSGAGGAPHLAAEMIKQGSNTFIVAGTPKDIVEKISADVREVVASDEVKSRLTELGGVPRANTPAQFVQMIDGDRKRYAQIIRDRKITVD